MSATESSSIQTLIPCPPISPDYGDLLGDKSTRVTIFIPVDTDSLESAIDRLSLRVSAASFDELPTNQQRNIMEFHIIPNKALSDLASYTLGEVLPDSLLVLNEREECGGEVTIGQGNDGGIALQGPLLT